MRVFINCIMLAVLILCLSFLVQAEKNNIIFNVDDPVGDDCGPCYYKYPTNEIFNPFQGLFDIRNFSLIDGGENYVYEFQFSNITDPWNSRFGFSMPLIQIYIDNEHGGSTDLFNEGANIKIAPEYPWNKLIKISGWWVRVFSPGDKDKNMVDLATNADQFQQNIDDYNVEVKDNKIRVELRKELTGSLMGANLYILVGSFDPFGFDHFRDLRKEESSWSFSADKDIDVQNAPRVIDLIVPDEMEQSHILGNFTEDNYCQIYPIKAGIETQDKYLKKENIIYLVLMLLFVIIIFYNKEDIYRQVREKKMN